MALSAPKNTPSQGDSSDQYPVAVFGSPYTIHAGAMVGIWAGAGAGALGKACNARAATCRVVGVADETVVADVAGKVINISRGRFLFKNSASAPVLPEHAGTFCYVEDDETVCATNTASKAGIVRKVTSQGVWVFAGLGVE